MAEEEDSTAAMPNGNHDPSMIVRTASRWNIDAIPPMQRDRRGHLSLTVNEHERVVAGNVGDLEDKSVELFDQRTGLWKYLPETNEVHIDGTGAVVKRQLYIFGGATWDEERQQWVPAGNEVLHLDRLDLGWQKVTDCPTGQLEGAAAVTVGTEIVLLGGQSIDDNDNDYYIPSRNVSVFDTITDEWKTDMLPDLTSARAYSAAGLVGSIIIIAGGHDEGGDDSIVALVEVLDLKKIANRPLVWKRVTDMPVPSDLYAGAVIGSRYFAVACRHRPMLYDAMKDTWFTLPDLAVVDSDLVMVLGSKLLVVKVNGNGRSVQSLDVEFLADVVFKALQKLIRDDQEANAFALVGHYREELDAQLSQMAESLDSEGVAPETAARELADRMKRLRIARNDAANEGE